MKAIINKNYITFKREEGDPKFYGTMHAKGEHALLHFIKKWMNARGFSLIKKLAQKDGHMVGDQYQPYLRTSSPKKHFPHVYIISTFYAIRGANEDWNKGEVTLALWGDIFKKGQKTDEELETLVRHPILKLGQRKDELTMEK